MIDHPAYPVEPWCIRETDLHLDVLGQSESVFALSNGNIGLRANLDEGEPHGLPGTYLSSVSESRPLSYAEPGFGYPETDEAVINVTNGKLIRLLVNDQPFDVRYGSLISHERTLDLRTGVLRRQADWRTPSGDTVRVTSTRLVSFAQRSIVAIEYEVAPLDCQARVVVQSELVANEQLPAHASDPRAATAFESALVSEAYECSGTSGLLVHRTRNSGLRIGADMDHVVAGPDNTETVSEAGPDLVRFSVVSNLQHGEGLRIVKFVAYGWSATRSLPAVRDQVAAALTAAVRTGWDRLLVSQREYLDHFWERSDVEIDGDAAVQQAVRFGLFHTLQSAARTEGRAIPAKGLTGSGYDGHAFWDTETFVLPVLTYTMPEAVAHALRWRHSTVAQARQRAALLGLRGTAFPWRTINGGECSSYWPASTAAFHINADIADAVVRYVAATGDDGFEREVGLELLVETARLWLSVGHHGTDGQFRIDGVTGPDEYSPIADNNVYTNLMAQANLRAAAEAAERHPDHSSGLGVDPDEIAAWRSAADTMTVPYDERLGVHPQSEAFTSHQHFDFTGTDPASYPLLLHVPYFDLYRKQVVKQADLVLAMHLRGHAFSEEQKRRNFAYYEALTVRDSSLSASTQAVIAAEVGHLDLAYGYLGEAAMMDLDDINHNTTDGVHVASLAGSWNALVAGFGGLRDHGGRLCFAPRLPAPLNRLAFNLLWRGCGLRVEITAASATYRLTKGKSLTLWHHGQEVRLTDARATTFPIASIETPAPTPTQPAGRTPYRRRPATAASRTS